MSAYNVQQLEHDDVAHLWHHYVPHKGFMTGNPPAIYVEGKGIRIKDVKGREFIDATSGGVWCVNVGYGNERIAKACYEQMKTLNFYAASAGSIPAITFATRLLQHMPGMSRVFFSSSGSEANEKAYKMVRSLAHLKKQPEKRKILYRDRDYHGTTLGTIATAGQPMRKHWFEPLPGGFAEFPACYCYRCPFGKSYPGCDLDCAKAVEKVIQKEGPDTVGAVIAETIAASGGMLVPVPEYYPMIRDICDKYGVLLILDEVVTGMGRTGTMLGYEHFGVTPDIATLAKGVASAYVPISLTVAKEEIFTAFLNDPADSYGFFRDISTFGGCTVSSAGALENLNILEEDKLVENSARMGARLLSGLQELLELPHVGDVRGKGLMCGVELVADKKTKEPLADGEVVAVVNTLAANGLLVGRTNRCFEKGNNTLYFAPPLIVTEADVDAIVAIVKKTLS